MKVKSHPPFHQKRHVLLAWVALLLLSSFPTSSAQPPKKHIEISKYFFQDSLQMSSSSDAQFYRLDLAYAPRGLNLIISVLPEPGSFPPELFVSHQKEFPQDINDADYSTRTASKNGIFISSQEVQDLSGSLYIGLICRSPKCDAHLKAEWTKEIDIISQHKSLIIGEAQFDVIPKQSSIYYTLSVPPHYKENIESVQIQLTKFSGDVNIFVSKSNKSPNQHSHDAIPLAFEGLLIIRDLPDLSGSYYIGVHALEASSSSISAVIQTNPRTTQDSAFLLTPGKPQKGVLLPKHLHQAQFYKIFLDQDSNWYGYLHITVNSFTGRALILLNNNGELPTAENHQWKGQDNQLKISSKDLAFQNQGLYYAGIFIDMADSDAQPLAYHITYSLVNETDCVYDPTFPLSGQDRLLNPSHTFISQHTPFFGVMERPQFKYFEALIPADQFPITIHTQAERWFAKLYFSTDPQNKHPDEDSQLQKAWRNRHTLTTCEVITNLGCFVYITAAIGYRSSDFPNPFSLSISSSAQESSSAIALENERLLKSSIPTGDLPARFYYHTIPSKPSVVSVAFRGGEVVIYAKRIKVNMESQEKFEIEALNEKTAEFTGVGSVSVPPLADSEITIVAISVYFRDLWGSESTFDILASSQTTEISPGIPIAGFVEWSHYRYFMVNVPRNNCVLLISSIGSHNDLVISYGENSRPTMSDHQFALTCKEENRIIEIDNTDIPPQESMAGIWVIGVHGCYSENFTLIARIEDQKMIDLRPGISLEMV